MTTESSVPKIKVGRDFKTGDVSGQIAVGKGITQIVYKDSNFILPDSSVVRGKSWLYMQGVRPTTDPENIFGRQQELQKIEEFFKQTPALAITGIRGIGKSTLASMYLDIIEKRGEFVGIFWLEVDVTIDLSDVVGMFFTVAGKPIKDFSHYKIEDLLTLFFRELRAAPYFLVLDNFEILLDPQTNKPLKPGFSDLIEKANLNAGRSRFLFIGWECPASEHGIRPKCYNIGGLDEQAAIKLLRRLGLTESDGDLKRVIELSGGHPKALILLAQLVKEGEKLSSILDDSTLWKGEVAENILDKVYEERLSEEERKLLQYVSLYREPVPSKAIAAVANDPNWTEAFVKKTALGLTRKSLLQKTGENYWEESLIHSYAYSKLADRIERHKLACQYYLSLPLPEKRTKKEDVRSLIEAHYHASRTNEYDMAARIILDSELQEDLDRWGDYKTLVELYTGVLPKDPLRDKPLLSDIRTHGAILGNLGNAYSALGQVEKAIQYYEKALAIAQEIGDRRGEGNALGNLGNAYSALGLVEKAIDCYQKALSIAQEIGDRRGEVNALGNLGLAYSDLGLFEKAVQYYEKALAIAQKIGDIRGEGNALGNLGSVYSNLGRVEEAIQYYEKALAIDREIKDRRGEGADMGNLGNAYSDLGQVEKAIQYYVKALAIAQEIGDRRNEGTWLGSLGSVYSALGQVEKAIQYYEKALAIAQEIGDRKGEVNRLGNLGLTYSALGQVEKAIQYYEKALAIDREIGDRRGEGADMGNLGNAYSDLGQVEKAIQYYEKALAIAQDIGDRRGEVNALGNLGLTYSALGQVEKAIQYYEKALAIAQEIGDRREEATWLNNLGVVFQNEKKYRAALACYLLAKDIRTQIKDPYLETTESNLKNLKEELGKKKFEKLAAEVAPRAEEIVRELLK